MTTSLYMQTQKNQETLHKLGFDNNGNLLTEDNVLKEMPTSNAMAGALLACQNLAFKKTGYTQAGEKVNLAHHKLCEIMDKGDLIDIARALKKKPDLLKNNQTFNPKYDIATPFELAINRGDCGIIYALCHSLSAKELVRHLTHYNCFSSAIQSLVGADKNKALELIVGIIENNATPFASVVTCKTLLVNQKVNDENLLFSLAKKGNEKSAKLILKDVPTSVIFKNLNEKPFDITPFQLAHQLKNKEVFDVFISAVTPESCNILLQQIPTVENKSPVLVAKKTMIPVSSFKNLNKLNTNS